jgi:transposase-like protein
MISNYWLTKLAVLRKFATSVAEKILPSDCRLPWVKYLNNVIDQDHRAIRKKWQAAQCFRSFHTAELQQGSHERDPKLGARASLPA